MKKISNKTFRRKTTRKPLTVKTNLEADDVGRDEDPDALDQVPQSVDEGRPHGQAAVLWPRAGCRPVGVVVASVGVEVAILVQQETHAVTLRSH